MQNTPAATEATKTALENSVSWFLADKLSDAATPIATKKYHTSDNQLIYITRCNVAESSVPRVKVQQFIRVEGGVQETGYHLFADHRLVKYRNDMLFGTKTGSDAAGDTNTTVTETEAAEVLAMVNNLANARQTL